MSEVASLPTPSGDGACHPSGNGLMEQVEQLPAKTETIMPVSPMEKPTETVAISNIKSLEVPGEPDSKITGTKSPSPANGNNQVEQSNKASTDNSNSKDEAERADASTTEDVEKEKPMDIEEQLVQMETGTVQNVDDKVKPHDSVTSVKEPEPQMVTKKSADAPNDIATEKNDAAKAVIQEGNKGDGPGEVMPEENSTPVKPVAASDTGKDDGVEKLKNSKIEAETNDQSHAEKPDVPDAGASPGSKVEKEEQMEVNQEEQEDEEGEEEKEESKEEEKEESKEKSEQKDGKEDPKKEIEEQKGEEQGGDEGHVPLLERPPEVSGRRQRRTVDRFTDVTPEVKRGKVEAEGSGTALGDCPCVAHQIQHTAMDALHTLHQLLFARPGRSHEVRKNLKTFNGFAFGKDSKEFTQKREKIQTKYTVAQLKALSQLLDLKPASTTREELAVTITAFLCEPKPSGREVKDMKRETSKKPRASARKGKERMKAALAEDGSDDEDEEEEEEEEEESDEEEEESDEEPAEKRKSTTPKRGAARRASPAKRASARSTPSKKTTAKRSPAKKVAEAPAPEKKTPRKPPTERGPPPPRSTQRKRKRAAESEEGPDGGKTPAKKNKVEDEAAASNSD